MVKKISIIGAGSWGTTLAAMLGGKGYNVELWVRETDLVDKINSKRENTRYLKNIKIPEAVKANNS